MTEFPQVSNEEQFLRWLEMVVALLKMTEENFDKTGDDKWCLAGSAIGPAMRRLLNDPLIANSFDKPGWYDEA